LKVVITRTSIISFILSMFLNTFIFAKLNLIKLWRKWLAVTSAQA
jgi:hypothetical protein